MSLGFKRLKRVSDLVSKCLRAALFWVITQRVVVISYRRFETNYLSHLQESRIFFWIDPCMWDPIGCPETSVTNYHYSLRNNPEERSSHLRRCGCLNSRLSSWLVEQLLASREWLCCMGFSNYVCAKFEVLTSTSLKIQVIWNVMLRRLVNN